MKTREQILDMLYELDGNIREHGWDASVDAAVWALSWVLDQADGRDASLRRYMDRPDLDRRREWIARGGNPEDWPVEPTSRTEGGGAAG